ncbi:MAG: glutathione S-transferase [Porticoccus sp.]|nr:glutathione S-transferase [Porticoccus sp.]
MLPILYSFRRCPYAIRARMALHYASIQVELREILLRDKPASMLAASTKGTVPVLLLPEGVVLDESYEVMRWALDQNDPDQWWDSSITAEVDALIQQNDGSFKVCLDHYKYADRHPEHAMEYYRSQAEVFLTALEKQLAAGAYLFGDNVSIADVAIFPFIRQFAFVDKDWFDQTPYPKLQHWLSEFLASEIFSAVMDKHKVWCDS